MSRDEQSPFEVIHVDDIPTLSVPGGPPWKPVRRHLGIDAFGINAFVAADAGEHVIEEHSETGVGAGGHQELYLVLRGAATFTIDGQEALAPAGTLVFVRDPDARRAAIATEPNTLVLVVGGVPGRPYAPSAWDYYGPAAALSEAGDRAAALQLVKDGLEQLPNEPTLLYNIACYEALAGKAKQAVGHLARAIELEPKTAEWAREDTDFDSVRDRPDFPA